MSGSLLLCELHAHTAWSDGQLALSEVVDLYGRNGFDVLCITDHAVRLDEPMPAAIDPWTWPAYATSVRAEATRAARDYGLIVLLGLELTDNHPDPDRSAHALACSPLRPTRRIWRERKSLKGLIHRYELFNRRETFAWVAEDGLPPLANGDFHRPEDLSSWKTLLRCEKDADAVLDCLRSRSRVYLTPFAADDRLAVPVAA
jgi:hypothetical protein